MAHARMHAYTIAKRVLCNPLRPIPLKPLRLSLLAHSSPVVLLEPILGLKTWAAALYMAAVL